MTRRRLWKLPPEALRRSGAQWQARCEAGFGPAMAVFVPVRQLARGDWHLALAPGASLPLTSVDAAEWTTVSRPEGADATHHLCMLVYDQPADRPGTTFRFKLQFQPPPEHLHAALPEAGAATVPQGHVGELELRTELEELVLAFGDRLARYLVRANTAPVSAGWAGAETPTLTFAFASCQYPAGMLDRPVAHGSYDALAAYLDTPGVPQPERLLLLGDQVYTDATYGLLDPVRFDDRYRMAYEEWKDRELGPLAHLDQEFLARVRMTPDDHEILDNWEPDGTKDTEHRLALAMQAYWMHQRQFVAGCEPVQIKDAGPGWRLFMTDTRTQRCRRNDTNRQQALILGPPQTEELEDWLREGASSYPDDLQIVTSAAMLLPRCREYMDEPHRLDGWSGYPASLHRLLAFVCDEKIRNVVFLSGDAHIACSASVVVRNTETNSEPVRLESHHAPALYAPYPFANETRWNLLLEDRFRFHAPGNGACYECTVEARIVDEGRQGCGLLRAIRTPAGWNLAVDVIRPRQEIR